MKHDCLVLREWLFFETESLCTADKACLDHDNWVWIVNDIGTFGVLNVSCKAEGDNCDKNNGSEDIHSLICIHHDDVQVLNRELS